MQMVKKSCAKMTIHRHQNLTRSEMAEKLRNYRRCELVTYSISTSGKRSLSVSRPGSHHYYYTK